jgi:hypothetical protein
MRSAGIARRDECVFLDARLQDRADCASAQLRSGIQAVHYNDPLEHGFKQSGYRICLRIADLDVVIGSPTLFLVNVLHEFLRHEQGDRDRNLDYQGLRNRGRCDQPDRTAPTQT